MTAKRLSMRKIQEVLRLKWERGLSNRQIAKSCSTSRSTVSEYVSRAEAAGLSWPLPPEMDEGRLETLLFPPKPGIPFSSRSMPQWEEIHKELKGKCMTFECCVGLLLEVGRFKVLQHGIMFGVESF